MLIEKWKRDNNIFKFATKETSQDSFFSWVIHGINCDYPDRIDNYNLAKEFLKEISPNGLKPDIDKIYEVKIIRQFLGIDILLVLNMNNGKQKLLIIENKTSSGLGDKQKESIVYYTKLLDEMRHNKDNSTFKSWEIFCDYDNIEDNIYSVLIRTNLEFKDDFNNDENEIRTSLNRLSKDYNFLKNETFFKKHINFINNPEKLESLIRIFEKYQYVDKLIKDYYEVLLFNLENDSLISYSDNNIYNIKERQLLEVGKTHFRTAYLCVACFNNLLETPIGLDNETIDTRRNDGLLKVKMDFETNSYCRDFKVRAFDFDNGNEFITDDLWQYISKSEEKNVRYIYLFTKKNDEFNKEYYIFKGLFRRFKSIKNNNDTYTLIWEWWHVSSMGKNGKLSIKRDDIEEYINVIEDLSIADN